RGAAVPRRSPVDPAGCGWRRAPAGSASRTARRRPRSGGERPRPPRGGSVSGSPCALWSRQEADHHAGGCLILWMAAKESSKIRHMEALTRPSKVGRWCESALRVLRERYLIRRDGEPAETPEEMCSTGALPAPAARGLRRERSLIRRDGEPAETPEEMCWRVALAIARAEESFGRSLAGVGEVAAAFYDMMVEGQFLPNSPTLMNAGKDNHLQYSACYVLPVGDSMPEIFDSVKAAAIIHQSGGGTGFAFSRLRPKNDLVRSTGGRASGPVSFLRVFNAATEAVKQGGTRRGANMGVLRVDHPDILEFIECKLDGGITNFNISVAVTDAFMAALETGGDYELVNPRTGQAVGTLSARDVFDRIVHAAWRTGDPGLIFIDRINASPANPTPELGQIEATNTRGAAPPEPRSWGRSRRRIRAGSSLSCPTRPAIWARSTSPSSRGSRTDDGQSTGRSSSASFASPCASSTTSSR